jgi:hypothetical protein
MKTIRPIVAAHRLPARLKLISTRLGSLLLLFQRMPVVQFLFPEANIIGGASVANSVSLAVTTVVGLGAYDSVAGATATITQVTPINSTTEKKVPAAVGSSLNFSFKCTAPSIAERWACTPNPPAPGLVHTNVTHNNTDSITGIPTTAGAYPVTIEVWGDPAEPDQYKSQAFTIYVLGFETQPTPSQTIPSNTSASLTCAVKGVPTGVTPTYQWYQVTSSGDVSITGANSATYNTPALSNSTSYRVKVTSVLSGYAVSANSNTAVITVNPALSPFETWASVLPEGQRGPNQTPQGDGVTNLEKFAFNMNALAPDVRHLTVGASDPAGLPGGAYTGGKLRLEFLRRKAGTNPGITYTAQFGSDLAGWLEIPVGTPAGTSIDADWERVTVEDPTGGTNRFGRVKVVQTP